ncbi:MAG: ATP-dependent metallopeptidase FtsH/Yme1/Tma family protein, partial [Proteobacteria bacterium]|nr:ATP-dependent metallopeptidase FtsH/Yme1/Tma family protein [Pseudomonadota bacterium]
MNDLAKNLLLWVIVAVVLMVVFQAFGPRTAGQTPTSVTYSQFLEAVEAGQIESVEYTEETGLSVNALRFERKDGGVGTVYGPSDDSLVNVLVNQGVEITRKKPETGPSLAYILINILPWVLILGVWIYFMRQMQQGGSKGAMSFGKSRAKMQGENEVKVTLADVAGCDEAKEEVGELVEFLRDPGRFQKLGGKIPRGVLMVGPPGTGKTLLARAIAGEAKVPFFSISGSDFVEMFVGVGASRVRDMFEQAKKHAPCIIFIDEIDAVGRHRGAGLGGGHDEREQTLNQLLVEMDGFEGGEGVIVIAATNRPDVLDPALLRPGRFDRSIGLELPDQHGRQAILEVHARSRPLHPEVDLAKIAERAVGMTGADLASVINEAGMLAAREALTAISQVNLEQALERILE